MMADIQVKSDITVNIHFKLNTDRWFKFTSFGQ